MCRGLTVSQENTGASTELGAGTEEKEDEVVGTRAHPPTRPTRVNQMSALCGELGQGRGGAGAGGGGPRVGASFSSHSSFLHPANILPQAHIFF